MTLSEYLQESGMTAAAFGRLIGVGRMSALRYARHERIPSKETMALVVKHTEGKVRPDDFYGVSS